MCKSRTPGPGFDVALFDATKNVARSLVPSGAEISTSLGAGVCAYAKLVSNSRTEKRMDRGMGLNLRIKWIPARTKLQLKNNPSRPGFE
jgi:hypothetical protein